MELDVLMLLQHVHHTLAIKKHVLNSEEQVVLIIVGTQQQHYQLQHVLKRNVQILQEKIMNNVTLECHQL